MHHSVFVQRGQYMKGPSGALQAGRKIWRERWSANNSIRSWRVPSRNMGRIWKAPWWQWKCTRNRWWMSQQWWKTWKRVTYSTIHQKDQWHQWQAWTRPTRMPYWTHPRPGGAKELRGSCLCTTRLSQRRPEESGLDLPSQLLAWVNPGRSGYPIECSMPSTQLPGGSNGSEYQCKASGIPAACHLQQWRWIRRSGKGPVCAVDHCPEKGQTRWADLPEKKGPCSWCTLRLWTSSEEVLYLT